MNQLNIFEESYSLANNEQLFIEEEVIEGDMVGDWEIILESNDPVSDFAYNYNWETYFQDSA